MPISLVIFELRSDKAEEKIELAQSLLKVKREKLKEGFVRFNLKIIEEDDYMKRELETYA